MGLCWGPSRWWYQRMPPGTGQGLILLSSVSWHSGLAGAGEGALYGESWNLGSRPALPRNQLFLPGFVDSGPYNQLISLLLLTS